ncbi:MAG: ABA4-like family protein [Rhizobiaceae bacterium]|jgi:hypothetical protein|nr:ABA4-like family protein [Rhizobiaceae bacterium]
MTPDTLFQLSGPAVMAGWLALVLAPLMPRIADGVAALLIPLLLSTAYTALILVHWSSAPGGFGSLADVMALFTHPSIALAGWLHYLAFDLFVGAWIVRAARREGINHVLVLPCLVLTFLFGPAGFLAFSGLRAIRLTETSSAAAAR